MESSIPFFLFGIVCAMVAVAGLVMARGIYRNRDRGSKD